MRPNFTECGIRWIGSNDSSNTYKGPISGVVHEVDRPYLIPVQFCNEFCGQGTAYYEPIDLINTVLTWILPVMGLLLQAPYESNQFGRTVKAMLRWLGSPISSMTCVLWNIKVLGKCALMVDMAARSNMPDLRGPFTEIRDSFYILSVMNQFEIRPRLPDDSAAEMLLRIALFSNSLVMAENTASLPILRKELASELRSRRRRGSVPVFFSLLWFLTALGFSIYIAFGSLGVRATALNLAMGLMLSWMPVFVLACIVDRNPYSTEWVRALLNNFLGLVAKSVREQQKYTYLSNTRPEDDETAWLKNLRNHLQLDDRLSGEEKVFEQFFIAFAGQGRTRWHYGVAHSILADIEDGGVSSSGRGWFSGDEQIRDNIIRGPPRRPTGLHHFSLRELRQALFAFLIVEGTLAGAFTLAYCTPTYGLGCRSGGFMIFMILTFFSFVLEIVFWMDIDSQYRGNEADFIGPPAGLLKLRLLSQLVVKLREPLFILLDLITTGWLFYIVLAQTVGSWETCDCVGSTWGLVGHGPGGYIDFLSVIQYKAQGIALYWGLGTAASMGVMSFAMIYIIFEWCTQGHLSTEDYTQALKGLEQTRKWKHVRFWLLNRVIYLLVGCPCTVYKILRRCLYCRSSRQRRQHSMSTHRKEISWTPMVRADENSNTESHPLSNVATATNTAAPHR